MRVVVRSRADWHDQRVWRVVRFRHLEPPRRGRVGGDRRHTNGVADDSDPATGGQRLALEELGRVEQLISAAEPQQTSLI